MSYGLGIDVGTVFIGAAVSSHGQARIVTVSEDVVPVSPAARVWSHSDLLAAGAALAQDSDGVVRLADSVPLALGGRAHGGPRLLGPALRSVLDMVTAAQNGSPEHVVLTCPAVWDPVRRQQLAETSRQAGLDAVTVVSEPEAAAAFFAGTGRLSEADVVLVYDLGAVTVDLTVVRVTVTGTEILGLPEALEGVGGIDVDDVVLAHVDRVLAGGLSALDPGDPSSPVMLAAARAECTRVKEALSRHPSATVSVELPAGLFRVTLRRAEFETMIRTGLESTLAGLHRSMASAGVQASDLAAVVLVGGSSRIPLVARILADGLGRPLLTDERHRHCVALGAAAIAASPAARTPAPGGPVPGSAPEPDAEPKPVAVVVPAARGERISRRRLTGLMAALVLLAGWTGYAVVPLVDGPEPVESTFAARPGTGVPGVLSSSGGASTRATVTSEPTRRAAGRGARGRPAIGTGRLSGPDGGCLDVPGGRDRDGTRVQLFECNPTAAQRWTAGQDGTLRALGKCLQADDDGAGARLMIRRCTGRAAQEWRVVAGGIRNPRSNTCVAVAGQPEDRAEIVTAPCRTSSRQQWQLRS